MAKFTRTVYNFNNRFQINDQTTDPTKWAIIGNLSAFDTTVTTILEERAVQEGGIDFGSHIGIGSVKIPLILYATTEGKMNDLIAELKEAFNPQLVEEDTTYGKGIYFFPGGDGFMPVKWAEKTGETTRNVMVFCKPLEIPMVVFDSYPSGLVRGAEVSLLVEDPRRYLQTSSNLSGSGTAINTGNYPTPVEITVAATGTTSTSLTITNTTTNEAIVVSTALSSGQTLVIDTRHQSVKLNNVEKRSMISATSKWIRLLEGNNTITVANDTNATVSAKWYSSWVI